MRYKIKAFALFSFLSFSFSLFSQTGCLTSPDIFNNLHVVQGQAHQIIPEGGLIITAPGSYHVLENITGQIIVDADDVFIELNGFTITGQAGNDSVIMIDPEYKNIVIQNGNIVGNDQMYSGVLAGEGVCALVLKKLHITNCDQGIKFAGLEGKEIKCCQVLDCFITGCKKGVELTHAMMSLFEDCDTCCCTFTSFDLINCKYNKFKKCKAVRTGNELQDSTVVGFSAVGGLDNLFYECMAEGIYKGGADSNWCTKAMGFYFGFDAENIPEQESKIVDCLIDSVSTTSWSHAFGIRLDTILNDQVISVDSGDIVDVENDFVTQLTPTEIDWSPRCNLIAFGAFSIDLDEGYYQLVKFDGAEIKEVSKSSVRFTPPRPSDIIPTRVQFSPNGKFLLINGLEPSSSLTEPDLSIYNVQTGALLALKDHAPIQGGENTKFPYSSWFSCGNKVVLTANGDSGGLEAEFVVYIFDGTQLIRSQVFRSGDNESGGALSISPDDKFLVINWVDTNLLTMVDLVTLARKDDIEVPAPFEESDDVRPRFNPLVCCGQYYIAAVCSDSLSGELGLVVFSYDVNVDNLQDIATLPFTDIVDVRWHPSGKYLAVSRGIGVVYIYRFNPQSPTILERIDALTYIPKTGAGAINLAWSPCGTFLAISGGKNPATKDDFEIIKVGDTVKNCLVDSNKVANCQGGICSVGIFGCSCCNGITRNVAYESHLNFSRVHDVWCHGAVGIDQLHFNVSIPPY